MLKFFYFIKRKDATIFMVKTLGRILILYPLPKEISFIIIFPLYCIIYIKAYKSDIYYLLYLKLIDLYTFYLF